MNWKEMVEIIMKVLSIRIYLTPIGKLVALGELALREREAKK